MNWNVLPFDFGPQRSSGRTPPAEPWLHNDQQPNSPQVNAAAKKKGKNPQQQPWIINSCPAGLYLGQLMVFVMYTDV